MLCMWRLVACGEACPGAHRLVNLWGRNPAAVASLLQAIGAATGMLYLHR